MLISRKVTKDKRAVTDFRYLNVKMVKNQSRISFTKRYIFTVSEFYMWSTACFRFKRCFSFIKVVYKFKTIRRYFTIFWQCFLSVSKDAYSTKYFPTYMTIIYQCSLISMTHSKVQMSYTWSLRLSNHEPS